MYLDDVRARVEKVLGGALLDASWAYLEEQGKVEEFHLGNFTIEDLSNEARGLLKATGVSIESLRPKEADAELRKSSPSTVRQRRQILSEILAHHAEQDGSVRSFRRTYLADGLLAVDDVEAWLKQRALSEGKSTWLNFPLADDKKWKSTNSGGIQFEKPFELLTLEPPFSLSAELLEYPGQDMWANYVPIHSDTCLSHLKVLASALSRTYGWREGEATRFILSGHKPMISQLRVSSRINFQIPSLSRITLEVDPTLTPKQVAAAYESARKEMLGKRPRSLTSKHLELARFDFGRSDEESWTEKMKRWNEENPDQQYSSVSSFSRDCRQATLQLLKPSVGFVGIPATQRRTKAK